MSEHLFASSLLVGAVVALAAAQPPRMGGFGGLRPPTENERGLRRLTPEEIPPNLNYYAMDPLYDPNAVLGWSPTRIEEKLNRGVVALPVDSGKVYLGWRLLKNDPQGVTFNVYRSTAGEEPTKLDDRPIAATTDFIDDKAPTDRPNAWFVRAIVDGDWREAPPLVDMLASSGGSTRLELGGIAQAVPAALGRSFPRTRESTTYYICNTAVPGFLLSWE